MEFRIGDFKLKHEGFSVTVFRVLNAQKGKNIGKEYDNPFAYYPTFAQALTRVAEEMLGDTDVQSIEECLETMKAIDVTIHRVAKKIDEEILKWVKEKA